MSVQRNPRDIRRQIRETIQSADSPPARSKVVEAAGALADAPESAIREQLDKLEADGFVYLVGDRDGGDPEVKLP